MSRSGGGGGEESFQRASSWALGWNTIRRVISSSVLTFCCGVHESCIKTWLSWFLFQQSVQLAAVEKKYHLLKEEAVKFQDMENKISTISEKCEMVPSLTKQLEDLNI
ncbi:inhibitor of nuclear factor kappa-B kinase-interacting protein [Crotalus adamanteus]|uniref:Inhibitor of nuclear factor kappa-B kinase-interacting protein n=1 Tax=Crotalus adamanteus TaxID=8729 RepID=A0AAW1BCW3_CROAD